jgi:hypothetical protein
MHPVRPRASPNLGIQSLKQTIQSIDLYLVSLSRPLTTLRTSTVHDCPGSCTGWGQPCGQSATVRSPSGGIGPRIVAATHLTASWTTCGQPWPVPLVLWTPERTPWVPRTQPGGHLRAVHRSSPGAGRFSTARRQPRPRSDQARRRFSTASTGVTTTSRESHLEVSSAHSYPTDLPAD